MASLYPQSAPSHIYERHRPETTALYEIVRDNLEMLYGAIDDEAIAVRIPKHARKELEAYLVTAGPLVAEECDASLPSSPSPARVRLWTTGSQHPLHGLLLGSDCASVTVLTETGGEQTFQASSLRRLEVLVGKRRHTRKGAIIGLAVGAVLGLLVPVDAATCGAAEAVELCSRGEAVAITAGVGLAVGALAGYAIRRDHWSSARLGSGASPPRGDSLETARGPSIRIVLRF